MPVDDKIKKEDALPDFAKMFADFGASMKTEINNGINALDKRIKGIEDKVNTKSSADPIVPPVDPIIKKEDEPKSIAELNTRLNSLAKENETLKAGVETEKTARINAEKASAESRRIASFNEVIGGFEFATPKAKQQFTAAYLPRVERDEQGVLIVKSDKGDPMDMAGFLKSEYEESTHFQPIAARGGAGVTPGVREGSAKPFNYDPNMTPAQLAALPADQQAAYRQNLAMALS